MHASNLPMHDQENLVENWTSQTQVLHLIPGKYFAGIYIYPFYSITPSGAFSL